MAQLRNITMILRCDTVKRILPRLKEIETLGMARSLGWKVHMRCANGYRQEARSMTCMQVWQPGWPRSRPT